MEEGRVIRWVMRCMGGCDPVVGDEMHWVVGPCGGRETGWACTRPQVQVQGGHRQAASDPQDSRPFRTS